MRKATIFPGTILRLLKHPFPIIRRCRYLVNSFYVELRANGAKSALLHVHGYIGRRIGSQYVYDNHFDTEKIQNEIRDFNYKPLITILMPVYKAKPRWLIAAIESVRRQFYENWELCVVDDASGENRIKRILGKYAIKDRRIRTSFLDTNAGIAGASNEALSISTGDFVGLLDQDDELTPDALYESVKAINETGNDLFYSDEDHIVKNGQYAKPFYKPDYSPDYILSQNYICHFVICRKSIIKEIDGFRKGFEGSQDHDLILRVLEKTNNAYHIPKILYHWRKHPESTSENPDSRPFVWEAGRRAVEEALKRRNIRGEVYFGKEFGTYRVKREIIGSPLVSIVIPFRDKPEFLKRCLDSILDKSSYAHYEIVGINNGSCLDETKDLMDSYGRLDQRICFSTYDAPFNYSAINNYGVKLAKGVHIVMLNNDTEIITPDWIEALLEHSQRPEVGVVGAKLYYPDNTIQHAGVVIGYGAGVAGHSHYHYDRDSAGYFSRLNVIHNLSAVTGALMMIEKGLFEKSGGLNEIDFTVALNDIDLCVRLLKKGYLNVFTPYCEAYHYESISRGYDRDAPEKQDRYSKEAEVFKEMHKEILDRGDPYYNHNLTLTGKIWDVK
ncbi:MAG: glycosyltransferase [Deltaproteobacteria bacterium]|nr:glycosyltransferase [Candidatus Zymogenaceae bacterium]